jgi:DNA-binding LacI/PurR family transcriptional regulator
MPTIKDVAREAGVSIATVSYVLNDKTEAISEDTRLRVWAAVEKTGYRPNVAARNLRSSKSRLIGYAWHDVAPGEDSQGNAVLDRFTYAMARSAEAAGYHILTFTASREDPLPVYDELIRTGRVDGFVIGSTVRDDPTVQFLIEREFPFVSFGRANEAWDFCWVDTDGAAGTALAVEHLAGLGHRKIAMAAWGEDSMSGNFRVEGYRAGLVVGQDFSVVGFDDAPMSPYIRPALTTLQQPIAKIGQALIEMLEAAIRGESDSERHLLLPPRLIIRQSSGPAPR